MGMSLQWDVPRGTLCVTLSVLLRMCCVSGVSLLITRCVAYCSSQASAAVVWCYWITMCLLSCVLSFCIVLCYSLY